MLRDRSAAAVGSTTPGAADSDVEDSYLLKDASNRLGIHPAEHQAGGSQSQRAIAEASSSWTQGDVQEYRCAHAQ